MSVAKIQIDELDTITTVNNANVLPIVDSNGETKKVSITQLKEKITEDIDLSDYATQTYVTTAINNAIGSALGGNY